MNFLADIDLPQALGHAIAMVVASAVMGLLWQSVQKDTVRTRGERVVAYPRVMGFLVSFGWLMVAGIGIATWLQRHDEAFRPALSCFILFVALILPLHLEVFEVRITWDELHIRTRSPWRWGRTIPFSSVRSCDYCESMKWYRIHTERHGIIRLPVLASGVRRLLAALPCKVPPPPPKSPFG